MKRGEVCVCQIQYVCHHWNWVSKLRLVTRDGDRERMQRDEKRKGIMCNVKLWKEKMHSTFNFFFLTWVLFQVNALEQLRFHRINNPRVRTFFVLWKHPFSCFSGHIIKQRNLHPRFSLEWMKTNRGCENWVENIHVLGNADVFYYVTKNPA